MSLNGKEPQVDELIMQVMLSLIKEYRIQNKKPKVSPPAHDDDYNLFLFRVIRQLTHGLDFTLNDDLLDKNRLLHLLVIIRIQLELEYKG